MQPAQGYVALVSEKPFTDRYNKQIMLYSFQLQGDNRWFRTGTNRPNCNDGDFVNFVFEQQGNNAKVDPKSIQASPPTGVPQQTPNPGIPPHAIPQAHPAGASVAPKVATRDSYWKDKEAYDKEVTQPRIAYAAAQKSAVSLIDIALKADILGFGNAKKADKLQMLEDYCDELTGRLALKLDSAHTILADLKLRAEDVPDSVTQAQEDAMYD